MKKNKNNSWIPLSPVLLVTFIPTWTATTPVENLGSFFSSAAEQRHNKTTADLLDQTSKPIFDDDKLKEYHSALEKERADIVEKLVASGEFQELPELSKRLTFRAVTTWGSPELIEKVHDLVPLNTLPSYIRNITFIETANRGHTRILQKFIDQGIYDDDIPDKQKESLLVTAIVNNQINVLRLLLKYTTSQQITDSKLEFLQRAVERGHIEMVKELLNDYEHIYGPDEKVSLFQSAVKNGHAEIVKILIDYFGIDVNTLIEKKTALLYAAQEDRLKDVFITLLEEGADPDIVSETIPDTVLIDAIRHHGIDKAQLLLEYGVNANATNFDGLSPFFIALCSTEWPKKDRESFLIRLFDAGADPNCNHPVYQNSPLNAAIKINMQELTKKLIEKGADINTQKKTEPAHDHGREAYDYVQQMIDSGDTPHQKLLRDYVKAIEKGNAQKAIQALDAGLYVNAKSNLTFEESNEQISLSLFCLALLFNKSDKLEPVITKLLKKNVDTYATIDWLEEAIHKCSPSLDPQKSTSIYHKNNTKTHNKIKIHRKRLQNEFFDAFERGSTKDFFNVLEKTPNLDGLNSKDQSPIMVAILAKNTPAVKYLLKSPKVKDLHCFDRIGKTAYDYAIESKNANINAFSRIIKGRLEDIQRTTGHHKKPQDLSQFFNGLSPEKKRQLDKKIEDGNKQKRKTRALQSAESWNTKRSQKGNTLLMLSAQLGNAEKVRQALKAGADPTIMDNDGKTAKDYAHENGHIELAKLLAQHEKPSKQRQKIFGETTEKRRRQGLRRTNYAPRSGSPRKTVQTTLAPSPQAIACKNTTALFAAIENSDIKKLQELLKQRLDMNTTNDNGDFLLIAALKKVTKAKMDRAIYRTIDKTRRVIRELLTNPDICTSVDAPGYRQQTALMIAVQDRECLELLFEYCSPELDLVDELGQTVFMHAAQRGSEASLSKLLDYTAQNLPIGGSLWELLIKNSHGNKTALILAAEAGNSGCATLLSQTLEAQANSESKTQYAAQQINKASVILAKRYSSTSTIEDDEKSESTLEATPPACPSTIANSTNTPLQRLTAAIEAKAGVKELETLLTGVASTSLLKGTIKVDGRETTLLHFALEHKVTQKFLKLLLDQKGVHGTINTPDSRGSTALKKAINSHRRGYIKLLLYHNAHVSQDHIDKVKEILANQNEEQKKHWQSLLELMQANLDGKKGQEESISYSSKAEVQRDKLAKQQKALLAKGIPVAPAPLRALLATDFGVNARLDDGTTLLMRASQAGSKESVEILLEKGADIQLTDNSEKTAFGYASESDHTAIANLLCIAAAKHDFQTNSSSWNHITSRHCKQATKRIRTSRSYSNTQPFYLQMTIDRHTQSVDQFPEGWSAQEVKQAIIAVMNNPEHIAAKHADITCFGEVIRGALVTEGTHKNVRIRVIISSVANPSSNHQWRIFTAYPLRTIYR